MPSCRIGQVSPSGAFGKRQRPMPSSSVSPVKIASALFPFARRQRLLPDRLPFRADDAIGAVLLELLAVAAVDQRIVVVRRDLEDHRQTFGRQRAFATAQRARGGFGFVPKLGLRLRLALLCVCRGRESAVARDGSGGCRGVCRAMVSMIGISAVGRFCHR